MVCHVVGRLPQVGLEQRPIHQLHPERRVSRRHHHDSGRRLLVAGQDIQVNIVHARQLLREAPTKLLPVVAACTAVRTRTLEWVRRADYDARRALLADG